MPWLVFSIIGTVAFAVSGAVVAIEERYDILGVLVLGYVTAFGGGILRNLFIGIPMGSLWHQPLLFTATLIAILIAFFAPGRWMRSWTRWMYWLDAIGLAAFSIQGSLYAASLHHGVASVIVASLLTGCGGGIIRDVLAKRKPLVLRNEVYALWSIAAGLLVGSGLITHPSELYLTFVAVVALRMLSLHYKWGLPRRSLPERPPLHHHHG